ncbi:MFS transporter, partial [Modestobacter altitudinis]|uniref:MFS transporter n=1 Tax=Modestobacter altitudinis TaxID=2213158 RepID=UPI0014869A9D
MPQRTTHGRLGALLAVMCAALALVIGAGSSLALAMPEIARSTGASQIELTWVVNVYALVFAALLLPLGIAADKYGRRTALLLGLGVFAVCSLASGLVTDPTQLIVLRALAGAGAAAVMPATLSVLVDAYPPERRSSAIGVWAAVSGAGALLGLLIAGVLLEVAWWGSVQIAFGVLSAVVLALCVAVVPPSADPQLSLDPVGGLLALVGLAGVVYGVIEGPERGWTDGLTVTALVGGVLVLAAFVLAELRNPRPMLDVRLFRSPGLSAGSAVVFLQFFAAFGLFFLAPQWLQYVHGLSPLQAALWLAPMALGIGPTAQAAPALLRRLGARPVAAWGMAQMAVGLGLLAWQADGGAPLWCFGAALFVFGIGFGLALTPGTTLIIDGLPADRRTLAAAVNDVTREVGGALGGAVAASVLLTGYGDQVLGAVSGLSAPDAARAEAGIAQALGLSARLGPEGAAVAAGARDAFATGYATALLVGAVVLLAGAVLCGLLSSRTAEAHRRLKEWLRTAAGGAPRRVPWTVRAAVTGVLALGVLAGAWLLPQALLQDAADDGPSTALAQDRDTARTTSAPARSPVVPVEAPGQLSQPPGSPAPAETVLPATSPAGPRAEAVPQRTPTTTVPPVTTSA